MPRTVVLGRGDKMVFVKIANQIPEPNLGKDKQMHTAKVMYAQIAVPM
jgi:hypothetical protein